MFADNTKTNIVQAIYDLTSRHIVLCYEPQKRGKPILIDDNDPVVHLSSFHVVNEKFVTL